MSRTRNLIFAALVVCLLALPSTAGAVIGTTSTSRGQLDVALRGTYTTRHYAWESLHFKLHSCEPGNGIVEGCGFSLSGRINPRWTGCPDQEGVTPGSIHTMTIFEAPNTDGSMAISTGRGAMAFPTTFPTNGNLLVCWYVHIAGTTHALLTAKTVIPPPRGVIE